MLYHFVHNSSSVLLGRVTPELVESFPLLKLAFAPGEDGQHFYRLPFAIAVALVGLALLWWFKSLPYHRSAEERLQEALDHQEPMASAQRNAITI
jgi:hypothetical protein